MFGVFYFTKIQFLQELATLSKMAAKILRKTGKTSSFYFVVYFSSKYMMLHTKLIVVNSFIIANHKILKLGLPVVSRSKTLKKLVSTLN